jgi:uncharacterized protein (TIGR00299 family) protein
MILGALIDSGLPIESLYKELNKLDLPEYSITCKSASRGLLHGTHAVVSHDPVKGSGYSINQFTDKVSKSTLSDNAKDKSLAVFEAIRIAESKVHGDDHTLHELGDLDTLIDVVGVVVGLEILEISKLHSSPLPFSWGTITTREGVLPLPAPATSQIMALANAKVITPSGPYLRAGELVTPTGAALITTLASFDTVELIIENVGYGIGTRDIPDIPNVLALWTGETGNIQEIKQVSLLETNIDDSTPEILAYVQEKLMTDGALDAWFTQIHMKKGRPGVTLSVLCRPNLESDLIGIILRESTTLGVRVSRINRYETEREIVQIKTSIGKIRIKLKKMYDNTIGISPEYEDCKELAEELGIPLQEVFRTVSTEAHRILDL